MGPEASSIRITAEQLLMLAGRLDDTPGFDTPRERFRRFLTEQIVDARLARALVDQWQRASGEQHRRALQDLVVLLGRFLGFETSFGSYQSLPGALRYDGQWRSRHRLHVVLEIRSDYVAHVELESLTRSLAALATLAQVEPDTRRLGLFVAVAPTSARFDEVVALETRYPDVRVVSARSLVALADMMSAGAFRHDEVVKLLTAASGLDLIVDLLGRTGHGGPGQTPAAPTPSAAAPAAVVQAAGRERRDPRESASGTRHWLALIGHDGTVAPDQVIELLVNRRRLLGVADIRNSGTPPAAEDWICLFVPGTGVTGHGQVASIVSQNADELGEGDRLEYLVRLKNVDVYKMPIVPVFEKEQRFIATFGAALNAGPVLAPISPNEFVELTTARLEPVVTFPASRSHA